MDLTKLITEQRNPHTLTIDELSTLDLSLIHISEPTRPY